MNRVHCLIKYYATDGRYLAYYLEPGSGSMTADGVAIRVLNLQNHSYPLDLGTGLKYPQWLAWSPDSNWLAYIRGYGRDATIDKRLYLADLQSGGKVTDCGSPAREGNSPEPGCPWTKENPGQVDTQPLWLSDKSYSILFCRGKENNWWDSFNGEVLVPRQRIWTRTADGVENTLTSGPADTADYAPRVALDGKNLFFLRLIRYDNGSLYFKPLAGGQETELIRGLTGNPGYYGNYYPECISIYWI